MTTDLKDMILAAMRDGEELAPWAEHNSVAVEDERVSNAVFRALGGPVPDDLAMGVPLLRFGDCVADAIPLVQAVMNPPKYLPPACDRCGNDRLSITDTLWVNAGASVVALGMCWKCSRTILDCPGGRDLIWS